MGRCICMMPNVALNSPRKLLYIPAPENPRDETHKIEGTVGKTKNFNIAITISDLLKEEYLLRNHDQFE